MMYRRHAAQQPRRSRIIAVADAVHTAVSAMLAIAGVYDQAWRENRQRDRLEKWQLKHSTFHARGLNGDRAVARRCRQIASGELTSANGLVDYSLA
jgi:hypothetical protein